ncbi:DUF4145 domain-containing protein [Thermodesulfobacteriota bacterium]
MILKVNEKNMGAINAEYSLRIRCPSCKHNGTFVNNINHDFRFHKAKTTNPQVQENVILGQRRCPEPSCCAPVFFVAIGNKTIVTYPAETIDFDSSNIPENITDSFQEAITCHANNCYIASAIMVRKTLEELCRDRGATGDDLKKRVTSLGATVVLPQELLDGLDEIRLLGNDAAHIESQTFNQVGKEEVEVGIEFTKEVLKAVYQYINLLKRLHALKKATS